LATGERYIPLTNMTEREESRGIAFRHRAAMLAIANALMVRRAFDAVMIHEIIATAPERGRRADWVRTCANASLFKPDRQLVRPN
jgi:hypothetical protein